MTPYRIVLADDHVLVRQGLRRILEGRADLEVVGEANDGLELLDLLNQIDSSHGHPRHLHAKPPGDRSDS